MEKVSFNVTYSPKDMYQAMILNRHKGTRSSFRLSLWGSVFIYLAIFSRLFSFGSLNVQIVFLCLGIFFMIYPYIYLRLISRRLLEGGGFSENHFVIDDAGVENTYDQGSSKHPWNEILAVRHSSKMLLIYVAELRFFIIPKRALTQPQWNELIKTEEKYEN